MARKMRKWNPGDAANEFVRVLLSDAGTVLGGFDEDEWGRTLDYFEPGAKRLAKDDYCHWLCVAEERATGETVGLPYAEVARRVRKNHPRASEASAKSHASYINTRKPGYDGFRLPDIRPR